ncbi:serine/threonine-protein kinase [Anabaena sp. PCC 7108]|uniref:serine/threonine-protein kinase n=1 Tax=Anabaena sp. PCC 7108 TaxID=163908 RepID=UPI00034CB666|nr:serine/threonine-protein kinase [Anabaena sp. PCC 7108]
MNQQIIGKLLQGRYQIVQSLGAGVFGQTYIAEDVDYPEKPRYVVKQLKVNSYQSTSYFDYLRLRFLTETETLKHLGGHNQIPELITCFEENERFYLVQEYIAGQPLSVELDRNKQMERQWSIPEVMAFIEDALSILEFVHSQGFIHCDVKPENLIRRSSDGKLVLIDFGSIQPVDFSTDAELPISQIPVTSLGYIPPEQFLGQTQPNSDLYALGMIAIQGLTGLTPLQLNIDPATNEIPWCQNNNQTDDYLAVFLSQMIRYNYQERFQSANEALWVFKHIRWENQQEEIITTKSSVSIENSVKTKKDKQRKSDPLLAGMRLGLAINSVVVGLGVYALVNNSLSYSEAGTLSNAIAEYQAGDLEKAISLAKSIPSYSNVYPEAQDTITEWQKEWHNDTENYLVAEEAVNEGKLSEAMRVVPQIPYTSYWRTKREKLIEKTLTNLEEKTHTLLNQAYASAENRDFSAALEYLRQVPPESPAGAIIQNKLAEYSQKKQMRAGYFLHTAYQKALVSDFSSAIKFLEKIPQDTDVYPQAQIKLQEYKTKLKIREKVQNNLKLKKVFPVNQSTTFGQIDSNAKTAYFYSPNSPREINISS